MKSAGGGTVESREARVEAALACLHEVLGELCREQETQPPPSLMSGADSGAALDDVLTNLYVAGLHLHSSLKVDEVLVNLREILINFVGVERFRIYFIDRAAGQLRAVADETSVRPACSSVALGEGIIGVVARTGIPYFETEESAADDAHPLACIPLKMVSDIIGVIHIDRLLPQKAIFQHRDHELLNLISEHAAPALLAAAIHEWFDRQTGATGEGIWGILSEVVALDVETPPGEPEMPCER